MTKIYINYLFTLSDKDFKEEIWEMLIELEENMEQMEYATNKNQEDLKVKIKKL